MSLGIETTRYACAGHNIRETKLVHRPPVNLTRTDLKVGACFLKGMYVNPPTTVGGKVSRVVLLSATGAALGVGLSVATGGVATVPMAGIGALAGAAWGVCTCCTIL